MISLVKQYGRTVNLVRMFVTGNHPAGKKLRDLPINLTDSAHRTAVAADRAERHLGDIAHDVTDVAGWVRVAAVFLVIAAGLYIGAQAGSIIRGYLE